jgi:hypothetical protein
MLDEVCRSVNMAVVFVMYIYNFGFKARSFGQKNPKKYAGYSKQICTRFCYRQMTGVAMVGTLPC